MDIGWTDKEFSAIIEEALKPDPSVLITDISSPPGTRKTYNVIRYAVEHRRPMVASFPNHQNQETALAYVLYHIEREKPVRLPFFVIDYAGVENYCILQRPELLKRVLDQFREEGQPYTAAVDNFLGHPTVSSILIARGADVDEIWYEIADALDSYIKTGDKKAFKKAVSEIIEKRGQHEICRNVCPLGLFAWHNRRRLYHLFSEPKVVTWRKDFYETKVPRYPRVSRHTLLADTTQTVLHLRDMLEGKYKPEWTLCPRFLLITQISLSRRSTRPTYILAKRSIILTPHSGLDFILSLIDRIKNVTGSKLKYILFIDEYDAMLKPRRMRLYPLDALRALIQVAEEIIDAGIGGEYRGETVTDYLFEYARYVRHVAGRVLRIVEKALEEGRYHPLVNIFYEGAFSSFECNLLRKDGLHFRPLGPRLVHLKYFAEDNLLSLILNMKPFFEVLASSDPEWRINLRTAMMTFNRLARVRVYGLYPVEAIQQNRRILTLRRFTVEMNVHGILRTLREYLRHLIFAPRYAVYYVYDNGKVRLAMIDPNITRLLVFRNAVLTSASPLRWDLYVAGTVETPTGSVYLDLVNDVRHSLYVITPPNTLRYADKEVTTYEMHFLSYSPDHRKALLEAIERGDSIPYEKLQSPEVPGIIRQISVLTTAVQEYAKLLRVFYVPTPMLYQPNNGTSDPRLERERIFRSIYPYITIIGGLARSGYVLVLTQNKLYAKILRFLFNGVPCRGERCGGGVKKITHYQAGTISITWFRSRAERGIDLPYQYRSAVVVGSPYPQPTTIVSAVTAFSTAQSKLALRLQIQTFRGKTMESYIALTPRDVMAGISELVQAVGRATRAALRAGRPVYVYIPMFLQGKIVLYAPGWMKSYG